jgi:hypothetical protein
MIAVMWLAVVNFAAKHSKNGQKPLFSRVGRFAFGKVMQSPTNPF